MTSKEAEILDKIRGSAYYSIRFRPIQPMDLSLHRTIELVQENAVRLRGWDFPHYDSNALVRSQRYVGYQIEWHRHVELWRLYQSGQFVYFGSPWDLATDLQDRLRHEFDQNIIATASQKFEIIGVLSFVGMIYAVTEFYLFAARLAKSLEAPGIVLETGLKNVENWALVSGEIAVPWHSFYSCRTPKIELIETDRDSLINDPVAEAARALKEMFQHFAWDNSAGAIQSWQERFMAGRYAF